MTPREHLHSKRLRLESDRARRLASICLTAAATAAEQAEQTARLGDAPVDLANA